MIIFKAVLILLFMLSSAEARSFRARYDFVKTHPCPSTGKTKGACKGWQVDHIVPLKCGGADSPHNMQWLTINAHKQKTKAQAKMCRKKK